MMQIFKKTNINFLKKRKIFYFLSLAGIIISILSLVIIGPRYGVDFSGGSLYTIRFAKIVSTEEIRKTLKELNIHNPTIQRSLEGYDYLIKIDLKELPYTTDFSTQLVSQLNKNIPNSNPEILKEETVGPRVSKELQRITLIALIIGIFGVLLYVSFRFNFRFGTSAILALIHDAIIAIGFTIITKTTINIPIVAALLTIIGYSVNDSIVVSDRVRENLKKMRKEDFEYIANLSINETLSRTVLTSLTTLFVSLLIWFFGTAEIKDFGKILSIGIISGTYSSIFVVTALVVDWEKKYPSRR
ncbi:MAG: protein translocase subunit SecF [candidate division WOR-3 bacterium]|nr:protein translocase subunit SecF [candidate division WOR-3 bacterium]MCX7836813.1 protein translocase subunit SecF [candidate division WOR-3 bacterium]MDW8113870.1 protein translocase subunit SecF [candidate division WOR-3 bacterium]